MKVTQSCPTVCNPVDYIVHGQNTGVGSCSLPQGMFSIQESNPDLLLYRQILYQLSHQRSPVWDWFTFIFKAIFVRYGFLGWHLFVYEWGVCVCVCFIFPDWCFLSSLDMGVDIISNFIPFSANIKYFFLFFFLFLGLQLWICWTNWSVQFSRSVVSNSLQPHESQYAGPPCPSPTPGVHSDSRPSSRWCHPAISSSVIPFSSCPQSLPASGSFPMSQLFTWGGESTGVIDIVP